MSLLVKLSYQGKLEYSHGQHGGLKTDISGIQLKIISKDGYRLIKKLYYPRIKIGVYDEEDVYADVKIDKVSDDPEILKCYEKMERQISQIQTADIYSELLKLVEGEEFAIKYSSSELKEERLPRINERYEIPAQIKTDVKRAIKKIDLSLEEAIANWEKNMVQVIHYLKPSTKKYGMIEKLSENGIKYEYPHGDFSLTLKREETEPFYVRKLHFVDLVYFVLLQRDSQTQTRGYVKLKDLPKLIEIEHESKNISEFRYSLSEIKNQIL